jgi:hypothetical protein
MAAGRRCGAAALSRGGWHDECTCTDSDQLQLPRLLLSALIRVGAALHVAATAALLLATVAMRWVPRTFRDRAVSGRRPVFWVPLQR